MALNSIIPSLFKHQNITKPKPNDIPHKLQCDSLAKLIRQRKWDDVLTTIHFLKSHYLICSTKCCHECTSNHGIIHHLCCYQPPLKIFKALINFYGDDVVNEQDCLYRYPIRAAVEYEANYEVIEFLLHKNSNAILQQDKNSGDIPLHIAINLYKEQRHSYKYRKNNNGEYATCQEYYLSIIRLLAKEVPMALGIANNDGVTPLQLIKESNIKLDVDKDVTNKRNSNLDARYFQKKMKLLPFFHYVKRRSIAANTISN